jgi:hypothetical protein
LLNRAGLHHVARLDAPEEIAQELRRFLDELKSGTAPLPDPGVVQEASRWQRAKALAALLERLPAHA